MQFFYSDTFNLQLPAGHRFPGTKYGMLRRTLVEDGILSPDQLCVSSLVADKDLHRAHAPDYIEAIDTGDIDPAVMRRIGFPWSPHIAQRARATMGGAVAAAKSAFETGLSGQLAGGTHHAHYDFGSGYCVFNDFAVAALALLADGLAARVAIVDLDVHQGDGNASILSPRDDIFVLSVHGEKNFPFRKCASDLDVNLPDGVEDDDYLNALEEALPAVWAFNPDIVLYQAGVDPLKDDRLGRMALSHDGLMARDRLVLTECKRQATPVSMAIGGGYADPIDASVSAYANTYRVAKEIWAF
ncbi:MAG: histone deacetylase [Pseudomonadota bacterium]